MTPWWQHVLFVGAGMLVGSGLIWLRRKRPGLRRATDWAFAVICAAVAASIALGHFTRLDAIWPVIVALDVVLYGADGKRAARQTVPRAVPAASSPRPAR